MLRPGVTQEWVNEEMIGAAGELDCFSAHIRLREPDKSEDKADYPRAKRQSERRWTRRSVTVPQRRIYRSRRNECRCKATDSMAMGLAAPLYRRGGTSMESSSLALMDGERWS
ncbi:hypothetical protein BHM03_00026560 [Ensete ventricosum]|nr:hypothetical protein BHM03_00026560 [Ensete ventricosum]